MKKIYIKLLLITSFTLFQITKSNPISAEPRRNPDEIKIDPQNEENKDKTSVRKSRDIPKYLAEITDATSHLFEAYNNDYLNKNNNNNNGNIYVNSKDNSAELSSVVNNFINTVQKTLSLLSTTEQNSNSQVSSNLQNVFNSDNSFAISVLDLPTPTRDQKLFKEQQNNFGFSPNTPNLQSRINQIDLIYDPPVLNPSLFAVKEATTDFRLNNRFNEAVQSNFNLESKFGNFNSKQEDISSNVRLPNENNIIFGSGDIKSQLDAAGNQRDIMYFAALSVPHKTSFDFKESNVNSAQFQDISSFKSGNSFSSASFQNTPSFSVDTLPISNTQNLNVGENLQQIPLITTSMFQVSTNFKEANTPVIFSRNNPSFSPEIKPLNIPLSSSQFTPSVPVFSNFDAGIQTSTASSFMTQIFNQNLPGNDEATNKITKLVDSSGSPTTFSLNSNSQNTNFNTNFDVSTEQNSINQQNVQNPNVNQPDFPETFNQNPIGGNNFNSLGEIPLEEHKLFDQIRKRLPLELTDSYGDKVSKFKRQNKKD